MATRAGSEPDEPTFKWISVGTRGNVWGVSTSGDPYRYDSMVIPPSWQQVISAPSSLAQISGGNSVWALDTNGNIFLYNAGASPPWVEVPGPPDGTVLMQLSAGESGLEQDTLFGLDAQGSVWRCLRTGDSTSWDQLPAAPAPLSQISAANMDTTWAFDAEGNIYQYKDDAGSNQGTWTPIPSDNIAGTLISISASSSDWVWCVNSSQDIYLYTDPKAGWYHAGNGLVQVASRFPVAMWGLNTAGQAANMLGTSISTSSGEKAIAFEGSIARPEAGSHDTELPRWDAEDRYDETKSTHLWIVNRAAQLASMAGTPGQQVCDLVHPEPDKKGPIGRPFHDNLCQGLYDADFVAPYNDPSDGIPTYASHFYDPRTGKNYKGKKDPTAFTRGRFYFCQARDAYRRGEEANAGYLLGLSLHYFTDLTQPMHSSNYTFWTSEPCGYHPAYESYVMTTIQGGVSPPDYYLPSPLGVEPDAYLHNAALSSQKSLGAITDAVINNWICWIAPCWVTFPEPWLIQDALNTPAILREAIQLTAQYLVAWMQSCDIEHSIVVEGNIMITEIIGPLSFTYPEGSAQMPIGDPFKVTSGNTYKVSSQGHIQFTTDDSGRMFCLYYNIKAFINDDTNGMDVGGGVTDKGVYPWYSGTAPTLGTFQAPKSGSCQLKYCTVGEQSPGEVQDLVVIVEGYED